MISIIVPVYNIADYLPRCVDSLLDQTYRDIEIILVDDGSMDSSQAICDCYVKKDSRVKVIHKKNGGLTSARNTGLLEAHGEWILNVDGDDWIDSDYVERCVETAKNNASDVVLGCLEMIWQSGETKSIQIAPTAEKSFDLKNYIANNWTCLSGSLIKKNIYTDNQLRSPLGISWQEDFYLIVRLCFYAQNVSFLTGTKYYYWQRDNSIMNKWSEKMTEDARYVFLSTYDFFKSHGVHMHFHKVLGWRLLNVSQDLLMECNFEKLESVLPKPYNYIVSCPYISKKRKWLYWAFAHGLKKTLKGILKNR